MPLREKAAVTSWRCWRYTRNRSARLRATASPARLRSAASRSSARLRSAASYSSARASASVHSVCTASTKAHSVRPTGTLGPDNATRPITRSSITSGSTSAQVNPAAAACGTLFGYWRVHSLALRMTTRRRVRAASRVAKVLSSAIRLHRRSASRVRPAEHTHVKSPVSESTRRTAPVVAPTAEPAAASTRCAVSATMVTEASIEPISRRRRPSPWSTAARRKAFRS